MRTPDSGTVRADRVGRQIETGEWVLRECSLACPPGTLTAIVGASGAGKTSLMHCLSGLDSPTVGRVLIDGADPHAMSRQKRAEFLRQRVGFVFQQYNLIDYLSVEENVTLPLSLAGARVDPHALAHILQRFGLGEKTRTTARALSCRVLLQRPQFVFADEPTGALDTSNSRLVIDVLHEVAASGATVVMVTHDVDAAVRADRVVFMRDGVITGVGAGLNAAQVLAGIREQATPGMVA